MARHYLNSYELLYIVLAIESLIMRDTTAN